VALATGPGRRGINMKNQNLTPVERETQYVAFLKKRLESENYRANVTPEEYAATKAKYDKAKFKLKVLRGV
jgi:hypothetical protein